MKRIIYITILSVSLCSCNDFLETDSPSRQPMEFVLESQVKMAINGIYTSMTSYEMYAARLPLVFSLNNDVENGWVDAAKTNNSYGVLDYTTTPYNSELKSVWNGLYASINRANTCIDGMEKSTLLANSPTDQPSSIRHLYGEAKALRALFYFELVRHWGDVPFKLTPSEYSDDFYQPRVDRDLILQTVIDDLIEVEPAMFYADQLPEGVERMNRGAVQGLIARIALFHAGWQLRPDPYDFSLPGSMEIPSYEVRKKYFEIARDYCWKLIEANKHSVSNASFKEVFLNQSQLKSFANDDVLYEIAFQNRATGRVGYTTGVAIVSNPTDVGSATPSVRPSYPYFFSFDADDLRRDVTCCLYRYVYNTESQRMEQTMVENAGKLSFGKWSKMDLPEPLGLNSQMNTGINWPIIRYADVLLMYAEAVNELDGRPDEKAKDALKLVRKRAFPESKHSEKVEAYVNSLNDKDRFFEAIMYERAWEFGGEAIRKYDLIRWNKLGERMQWVREKTTEMGLSAKNGTPAEDLCPTSGRTQRTYPDKIYYRVSEEGTLEMVGHYERMANPNDPLKPYKSFEWGTYFCSNSGVPTGLISNGYREEIIYNVPFVYLLPISVETINESRGMLQNYCGLADRK